MAHIIRIGSAGNFRIVALTALFFIFSFSGFAQTCNAGVTLADVHAEGLAEKVGNVILTCTGGTAGSLVTSNFFIALNANVTNRLTSSGTLSNISVTVGAFPTGAPPVLSSPTSISISGAQYTVPSPNTLPVTITVSGIRVAIPTLTGQGASATAVTATILATGIQILNGTLGEIGLGSVSLLDSVINNGIPCVAGSSAPATMDFPGLLAAGTASSTIRITEGYNNALPPNIPPDPTQDTGVRILVNLSGYGSQTQVYVPDAIVGNDGVSPTSSGAFDGVFSGGSYAPGQLLLLRVQGADATGAGGSIFLATPTGPTSFASVSQLTMSSGAGYAVYEVVDGNPSAVEYAQIPVFTAVPQNSCAASGLGTTSQADTLGPELAPVSNVAVATPTDPIPRFIATTPGSDCSVENDCNASYFPQLQVNTTSITLTGASLGLAQKSGILVTNSGMGQIAFTVSVTFPAGETQTSWLSVSPTSGTSGTTVIILANPATLQQGQYLATITINAGSAGSATIALTFNVGAEGVTIQSIVNSATLQAGAITPDSFATIFGANLNGTNVQAVFNGYLATVVYDSAGQINLLVPAALGTGGQAGVYVTVNGSVSNTFPVNLTANAPAIFTPGILNQNNTVNLATQPASVGDFVQVFLTGLAIPVAGPVTVNIGNQMNLPTAYAGPSSINGLEQVNVQVPAALTFSGNSTSLSICIPGTGAQPICSNAVSLFLH
jgi:uncharacterized protein (TIGR03437 family)